MADDHGSVDDARHWFLPQDAKESDPARRAVGLLLLLLQPQAQRQPLPQVRMDESFELCEWAPTSLDLAQADAEHASKLIRVRRTATIAWTGSVVSRGWRAEAGGGDIR